MFLKRAMLLEVITTCLLAMFSKAWAPQTRSNKVIIPRVSKESKECFLMFFEVSNRFLSRDLGKTSKKHVFRGAPSDASTSTGPLRLRMPSLGRAFVQSSSCGKETEHVAIVQHMMARLGDFCLKLLCVCMCVFCLF